MSHYAVNWALEQKSLKPAAKLVLICLADRHNKDTGDCFPSQVRLAEDACISRASLNTQLAELEALGYFTRLVEVDPATKRQRPTRYNLNIGFFPAPVDPEGTDDGSAEGGVSDRADGKAVSKNWTRENTGAVSKKQAEPCPDFDESRVQNLDTNPVRLTRKLNPTSAGEREAAPEAEQQQVSSKFSSGFLADLLGALGVDLREPGKWWSGDRAEAHIAGWLALGLTEDQILAAARKSRERHAAAPDGPKALDSAMKAAALQPKPEAPASQDSILAFWAERLNAGAFVAASSIKISLANALIQRGLVSSEILRSRGIAFTVRAA